jgi:hypothetical protein
MPQCTAKSKRTGERCGRAASAGRTVCYYHGGRSPRGLAHPSTKTGRFSKDLPTRLLAHYQAALADPELVALREELALVTAHESDLLARVDTGEAGAHWRGIRQALGDFRSAQRRQDGAAAGSALREMERLVDLGIADYRAWAELLGAIESRRRLAETERRRLEAMQQTITTERAMLLVAALVDAVRRHADDRKLLDAIGREVERIVAVEGAVVTGGDR